nr:hypothetical protein [Pseudoxanthomonas mexicana]
MTTTLLPAAYVRKIVLIQRCSRTRTLHGIEFLSRDAVILRRARHELEQPLRTTGVARIGVEAAARLDVGEPEEILAGNAARLCLAFDDIKDLFTGVVTGHHWLLLLMFATVGRRTSTGLDP